MDRKLSLLIQFASADKLSGSLRNIVGLGQSGAQKLAAMKREARELDQQLREARAATAGASGNLTPLIDRERELERAIAGANRQMERQKRFITIDHRVAKMQAQAASYKAAGTDNMIGGAGMLAPFILAGKQAMDFSSGMVDIQQKAELTNVQTRQMAANIMAAARAAHQLPEDMRASVDVLSGFGMDPRQAVQLAGPIGRLGTAFKVDLADGAAAAFSNVNNLKVALGDGPTPFDMMAAAGNAGAFEVKDMARWFPELTSAAKALGQQGTGAVADLTAALQIARRGAGSADQAATNVANLLAKINSPETIQKFQKNFGVDLPAALHKAYREGKTPLEAIAEITKKATGGNLEKLGFAFQDMQAQSALRSLILDMDDYRKIRSDVNKASGTVDRAFSQREIQDASVKWKDFTGRLQASAIVLGAKLLPAAVMFMDTAGGVVSRVADWAQANPKLASGMLTLIAGMAAARVGIGALQFAFGTVLGPMATVWGWWMKFRELGTIAAVFPRLASAFGVLRTAAIFLGQGFMRAGMMMLANPMILIITAIVVAIGIAGYLIYKHWDTIKAAFATGLAYLGQAWEWIKGVFNSGVAFLRAYPAMMVTIGMQIVQGIARGIMAAPGAVWNALKSIVMGGIANVKAMLGIKSPSRVFMGIGGYMAEGLALGVERGQRRPLQAVGRMAAGVAGAGALALGGPAMAGGSPGRAGGAGALAVAGSATGGGMIVNITVQQQPGEDGEALARRIMDMIKREQGNSRRGSYHDD